jgi:hypothetical protein
MHYIMWLFKGYVFCLMCVKTWHVKNRRTLTLYVTWKDSYKELHCCFKFPFSSQSSSIFQRCRSFFAILRYALVIRIWSTNFHQLKDLRLPNTAQLTQKITDTIPCPVRLISWSPVFKLPSATSTDLSAGPAA